MTDDEALAAITERLKSEGIAVRPRADARVVVEAERRLGFALSGFYVRLLTEIANGGFGPGYGLYGLPPDGHGDDDIGGFAIDAYLRFRAEEQPINRPPRGLLFLCNWGCGTYSHLDCLSADGRVVTEYVDGGDGSRYHATSASLREWLARWAAGVDVQAEMFETVGYRDGINPFTRKPMQFPITRVVGERVDFSDRL